MNTIPHQGMGTVSLISNEMAQFPTGIVFMMNTHPVGILDGILT